MEWGRSTATAMTAEVRLMGSDRGVKEYAEDGSATAATILASACRELVEPCDVAR